MLDFIVMDLALDSRQSPVLTSLSFSQVNDTCLCTMLPGLGENITRVIKTVLLTHFNASFLIIVLQRGAVISQLVSLLLGRYFHV